MTGYKFITYQIHAIARARNETDVGSGVQSGEFIWVERSVEEVNGRPIDFAYARVSFASEGVTNDDRFIGNGCVARPQISLTHSPIRFGLPSIHVVMLTSYAVVAQFKDCVTRDDRDERTYRIYH